MSQQTFTKILVSNTFHVGTITKLILLAQEVHANSLNNELVQDSKNEEQRKFDDLVTTKFFDLLSTKTKTNTRNQKTIKKRSKSNAQKRANLPFEIFDYILIAKCWQLFLLA